jgi:ribonuclease BN (tRNA processing enzyme)
MRIVMTVVASVALLQVGQQPAAQVRDRTQVVLLGTGTPRPEPTRSGPATAVVVGDTAYLVDVGPGIVRRAEAAFEKGVAALAPDKLTTAFITHLHSDHTVGLPDLISDEQYLSDVRRSYSGKVVVGNDLDIY